MPSEMYEKQFLFSVFRLSEFQYSLASVSAGVTVVLETDLLLQFGSKKRTRIDGKNFYNMKSTITNTQLSEKKYAVTVAAKGTLLLTFSATE